VTQAKTDSKDRRSRANRADDNAYKPQAMSHGGRQVPGTYADAGAGAGSAAGTGAASVAATAAGVGSTVGAGAGKLPVAGAGGACVLAAARDSLGSCVVRKYGFPEGTECTVWPGNFAVASSADTAGKIITSCTGFHGKS
jgi:hypothetical protein